MTKPKTKTATKPTDKKVANKKKPPMPTPMAPQKGCEKCGTKGKTSKKK